MGNRAGVVDTNAGRTNPKPTTVVGMATDKYDPIDPAYTGDLIEPDDPVLLPALADEDAIRIVPVKRSNRADWYVNEPGVFPGVSDSAVVARPDIVSGLRAFFSAMDEEIDRYEDQPVATAAALARIETLLADMRYLRDRLQRATAASMHDQRIRKLTVSEVVSVEASSQIERRDWQHAPLLRELVTRLIGPQLARVDDGEILSAEWVANVLLGYFRPEWRLTALRDGAGLDPDDYCTIARDEAGKIAKTPTVRIVDNRIRSRKP